MEQSLQFTMKDPPIQLSYPFNEHAEVQQANYKQILAVQRAHEGRTLKMGVMDEYITEMEKYKEAGTITAATQQLRGRQALHSSFSGVEDVFRHNKGSSCV